MHNNTISRREFGLAAGAASMGLMTSGQSATAIERGGEPVNYSRGLIESPPTYYEVLEPAGGAKKPPMVLVSGGAHTGACYLATADGRPGWAHAFVRAGYKVVVPDWPGVGRSGYIPFDDLTGEVVVEGLGKVVASLGQPAIIMTHSMSGAYGWKLIENYGQLITKVVAIAPGPPGNIQAVSDIISETGDTVVVRSSVSRGDVLGAERKFVEIANVVAKIREQADVVEARALFEAGKLAEERVDWRAANAHYARAARLQPSNRQYAQRAGNLARQMGDYATAASFDEATLSLVTSALGPDAAETASALNSLASTYQSLARYAEAEPLFRRAIEIGEKTLGKDHPDVAAMYNNLAILLRDEGKYEEAEPLYRRAIEIHEKVLGKDHPGVATGYNNLAGLLGAQGKYDEAEPLYRRAIEIDEKVLGKDHPGVATGYNNLAGLLGAQGKYDEAEPLYRRAIEIDESDRDR